LFVNIGANGQKTLLTHLQTDHDFSVGMNIQPPFFDEKHDRKHKSCQKKTVIEQKVVTNFT